MTSPPVVQIYVIGNTPDVRLPGHLVVETVETRSIHKNKHSRTGLSEDEEGSRGDEL